MILTHEKLMAFGLAETARFFRAVVLQSRPHHIIWLFQRFTEPPAEEVSRVPAWHSRQLLHIAWPSQAFYVIGLDWTTSLTKGHGRHVCSHLQALTEENGLTTKQPWRLKVDQRPQRLHDTNRLPHDTVRITIHIEVLRHLYAFRSRVIDVKV